MKKINIFLNLFLALVILSAALPDAVYAIFEWRVVRTAQVQCTPQNTATIKTSFTNNEANAMNVTLENEYAETKINLGTIGSGQTKITEIDTKEKFIRNGLVIFHLTWADGRRGFDKRSTKHKAISCVKIVPASVKPSAPISMPTSTPTLAITPTATPASTPNPNVLKPVVVKELPKTGVNPAYLPGLLTLFSIGIFLRRIAK